MARLCRWNCEPKASGGLPETPPLDLQGKEPKFKKGDIALYKQFDGKIRRVEVVDVEDDEYGDFKYSVELDATVRVTTEDRLSHIPKAGSRPT